MKTINITYAIGIGVALLLGAFAILVLISGERPVGASLYNGVVFTNATTSTSYSINGIGSTRVLATTTNPLDPANSYTRVWASLCNPNATLVYINLNNDKPVNASSTTAVIGAAAGYNACYEITDRNM